MQTILREIPAKTGMPPEETIGVDLLKKFNSSGIPSVNEDSQFLSAQSLVYSALSKSNRCAPDINEGEMDAELLEHEGSSLVQRKLITGERSFREDCSIKVVASLVDKPNNLGGLCRTCEIFGVDELIIADPIFLADAGFKALSMSSERKQKIEFVNSDRLSHYLEEMRKMGYTVIAAEQTTDSVFLHKFSFPRKTVLLLGDEKEGVPTNLLRCVDQTVEIQQLGQTRSLNVHVSAALFIAKYAEQVLLS
ncbi:RNA methyltransferase, TrmH family, partial [Ostertagia ostertagi]